VLQATDPPGEPSRAEQGHQQSPVDRDHRPGHPGRGQHHGQADGQGAEGAGIGGDLEAEPRERGGRRYRVQGDPGRVVAEQAPPERVGKVGQPAGPPEHRVGLEEGQGQLERLVGDGPPAGTVAQPGGQPAQPAAAAGQGRGRRDRRAQQASGHSAVDGPEPAGDPGGQHDGQQQAQQVEAERHHRHPEGRRPGWGQQEHEQGHDHQPDSGSGHDQPERDPGQAEQQLAAGPAAERRQQHRPAPGHDRGQRTSHGAIVLLRRPARRAPTPRRPGPRRHTGRARPGRPRATGSGRRRSPSPAAPRSGSWPRPKSGARA
jgi:hypothetical protein